MGSNHGQELRFLRKEVLSIESDCSGLSKLIFMSLSRQTSPIRLFMLSIRSGNCSVDIEAVRLLRRLGGGRCQQKTCSLLCCNLP